MSGILILTHYSFSDLFVHYNAQRMIGTGQKVQWLYLSPSVMWYWLAHTHKQCVIQTQYVKQTAINEFIQAFFSWESMCMWKHVRRTMHPINLDFEIFSFIAWGQHSLHRTLLSIYFERFLELISDVLNKTIWVLS